MSERRGPRAFAFGLTTVALVAAFVGLEIWRDRVYGEPAAGETVLYIRSGDALRRMSLGFKALAADLYWIRTVQYYGGTRLSKAETRNYDLLYPLLDITTTLDPHFIIAYRFGSIFLAEGYPGGPGRPDQAITLLKKGFQVDPARWRYAQDIGFVYYWWLQDYRSAAEWFEKAAGIAGAPWWLRSLAAVTRVQGGDRRGSRALWQSLRESADNDWLRNNATLRLAQLDALDAIDQLTAIAAAYRARTGEWPASWDALVRARLMAGKPVDPGGVPYVLDPANGTVTLGPDSPLLPLPVGGQVAPTAR